MQEEVTQKTIALVIKAAKLDANILKSAMRMYLNHCRKQAQKTHGKVSVKELVGEGAGASSIEITDGNIKSFERVARKYNVDFAVKKDKTTEPPKYLVFFKGRDADAVAQALKEFVYGNEKKNSRTSVRQKLKHFRDVVSKDQNKERSREKNKDISRRMPAEPLPPSPPLTWTVTRSTKSLILITLQKSRVLTGAA